MKNLGKSLIIFLIFIFYGNTYATVIEIKSPGGNLAGTINIDSGINFSMSFNGYEFIRNSTVELKFSQQPLLGHNMEVVGSQDKTFDETWTPVAGRYKSVRNNYNEKSITLRERYYPHRMLRLIFRAYNDGLAFRYFIPEDYRRYITNYKEGDFLVLDDEVTTFRFSGDYTVWAADYGSYVSHQEGEFVKTSLGKVSTQAHLGLPLLVKAGENLYAAITEAELTDFAGMHLKKNNDGNSNSVTSDLSPLPDGSGRVRIKPGSYSPWRVIMAGSSAGQLVESEIIPNLNEPCKIKDTSWIVPGIGAWDHWWSGDVKMDTETLEKYIKLASDMGWSYAIIDWYWYGPPFTGSGTDDANPDADITKVNPAVNMPEVLDYARKRNIRLILWLEWEHAARQMDEAFALYEKWGIAGVKIDFMQRDDQDMVNFYHRAVETAAEHRLVVDFHGAYKPTGYRRTYPNLITREGVMGNEYNKWSLRITPEHNCTLPFTRMLAGPMDYTPGGFLNRTPELFRCGSPTYVMTTRCQQLAMFVVYDSPFTVACDAPENYYNQPGIDFLKVVPTTWDDTKVIKGEVGEYIVMARKKDTRWYIGAMNNSQPRELNISLDFLDQQKFKLVSFSDADDSDTNAEHIDQGESTVKKGDALSIKMAPGGGYAAYLVPVK
jgi:alpha-glucosidase